MGLLAKLWHQQGRSDDARELLIDCLKGLVIEAKQARGSDRELFEEWFQNHRAAYFELFPDDADSLAGRALPDSTLG